jgi:hypothetical protein
MRRTWLRNVNWCMSWSKLFAVACADAHWQAAVALLMARADVIVVDVVNLRENVAWEIEQAYAEGAPTGCSTWRPLLNAQESAGKLKALLGDRLDAARIFVYDSRGLLEPARFRAVLAKTLASRASLRPSRLAIAATTLFVLTAVPLIALPFPFLGIPLLPRWNEWSDSHTWPGLAAIVNPGALATMGLGVVTWLALAAAARRNHAIRFLLTGQTLLLLAAAAGTMANRYARADQSRSRSHMGRPLSEAPPEDFAVPELNRRWPSFLHPAPATRRLGVGPNMVQEGKVVVGLVRRIDRRVTIAELFQHVTRLVRKDLADRAALAPGSTFAHCPMRRPAERG